MLHNIIQIALGIVYGIYLAFLAPASVRQQAYDWAKQQDTAANTSEQPVFFQVEPTVVASKPESPADVDFLEDPWLAELPTTRTQSQESSAAIALIASEQPLLPPVATLDWLVARVQPVTEEFSEAVDILALARERVKSVIDLTALKIYKLRGESVVYLSDLTIDIPTTIKRYKLRGKDVVKLSALEAAIA